MIERKGIEFLFWAALSLCAFLIRKKSENLREFNDTNRSTVRVENSISMVSKAKAVRFLISSQTESGWRNFCVIANLFWVFLIVCSSVGFVVASDGDGVGREAAIPKAVAAEHFLALKQSSPFTRTIDISDSLLLTGVAEIDGKPVATLIDTKTSQSYVISETPNSEGWKMVGLTEGDELEQLVASISVSGGEVVNVRYDREGVARSMKARPSASGGPSVPRETDKRALPTDEDRRKFGEYIKKRQAAMTPEQRHKIGEMFGAQAKKNPKMSDRQKGELYIRVMNHVAPEPKK